MWIIAKSNVALLYFIFTIWILICSFTMERWGWPVYCNEGRKFFSKQGWKEVFIYLPRGTISPKFSPEEEFWYRISQILVIIFYFFFRVVFCFFYKSRREAGILWNLSSVCCRMFYILKAVKKPVDHILDLFVKWSASAVSCTFISLCLE